MKTKITKAFAVTPSEAYRCCVGRRLRPDESVDTYIVDLQYLLELSGHPLNGEEDSVIIEQLLAGLPGDFAHQVTMSLAGKKLKIDECVEQIRAVRTSYEDSACSHGNVAAVSGGTQVGARRSSSSTCFNYNDAIRGHGNGLLTYHDP